MEKLDWLILSPKPPSSGMETDYEALSECINIAESVAFGPQVSLKVVVMSDEDYEYAVDIAQRYYSVPFYFSVGNDNPPVFSEEHRYGSDEFNPMSITERMEWLIGKASRDRRLVGRNFRIIPQVHTLLWGNKAGV